MGDLVWVSLRARIFFPKSLELDIFSLTYNSIKFFCALYSYVIPFLLIPHAITESINKLVWKLSAFHPRFSGQRQRKQRQILPDFSQIETERKQYSIDL